MVEKHIPVKVIALNSFRTAVKKLMNEEDIKALASELRKRPNKGDILKGTGGVRKVRWAHNQGKRGGFRIIYFYQNKKGQIFLITAYTKNQKENLTATETKQLKQLTDQLKG